MLTTVTSDSAVTQAEIHNEQQVEDTPELDQEVTASPRTPFSVHSKHTPNLSVHVIAENYNRKNDAFGAGHGGHYHFAQRRPFFRRVR